MLDDFEDDEKNDSGVPSAVFVVVAEVPDHKNDVQELTYWCLMVLTTQVLKLKSTGKMAVLMPDLVMGLAVVDL